ncbi:MAG: hypothetical protein JW904_00340 [Spirochaetales bacterium]|nr:hypothetical protein [Spirochaetales bacterium]
MNTFLVTDTHDSLGLAIIKNLLPAGHSVIAAPSHDNNIDNYKSLKKKPLAIIPWNKKSPISAKNVVLQGINKFSGIDDAILILSPDAPAGTITSAKYIDIENSIDIWLKGTLFILRELLVYFSTQQHGSLSCIQYDYEIPASPINDICIQGISLFLEQCAAEWKNSNIHINRFYSRSADVSAFADFITSTIKEKCYKSSGKLFRF